MKYNGTTWDTVGQPFTDLRKDYATAGRYAFKLGLAADNLPYISYYEEVPYLVDSPIPKALIVRKFDGTDWQIIHADSGGIEFQPAYLIDAKTGLPSYCAITQDTVIQLMKNNNGTWQSFAKTFAVSGSPYPQMDLLEYEEEIYAAYVADKKFKVTKWNGENWQLLGNLDTLKFIQGINVLFLDHVGNLYLEGFG